MFQQAHCKYNHQVMSGSLECSRTTSPPAVASVAYVASLVSSNTCTPLTAVGLTPDTNVRTCPAGRTGQNYWATGTTHAAGPQPVLPCWQQGSTVRVTLTLTSVHFCKVKQRLSTSTYCIMRFCSAGTATLYMEAAFMEACCSLARAT